LVLAGERGADVEGFSVEVEVVMIGVERRSSSYPRGYSPRFLRRA
jgi:hypothetical protein